PSSAALTSRSAARCTRASFQPAHIAMPSNAAFLIIAAITLVSAACAMSLRNLVHCGLCLAITFAGLAAAYLHLSAEFVGFAQILVYVGAVAILIVFTILLTRNTEVHLSPVSLSWLA